MKAKEVVDGLKQTESIAEKSSILLKAYVEQAKSLMDKRFGTRDTPVPTNVYDGIERELDDWLLCIRRNGNDWIREDACQKSLTKLLKTAEKYDHTEPSSIDIDEHLRQLTKF